MKKETGGPAFPPMHDPDTNVFGMTLRDYFAAKAMEGMFANPSLTNAGLFHDENFDAAYVAADKMLKAREA